MDLCSTPRSAWKPASVGVTRRMCVNGGLISAVELFKAEYYDNSSKICQRALDDERENSRYRATLIGGKCVRIVFCYYYCVLFPVGTDLMTFI